MQRGVMVFDVDISFPEFFSSVRVGRVNVGLEAEGNSEGCARQLRKISN